MVQRGCQFFHRPDLVRLKSFRLYAENGNFEECCSRMHSCILFSLIVALQASVRPLFSFCRKPLSVLLPLVTTGLCVSSFLFLVASLNPVWLCDCLTILYMQSHNNSVVHVIQIFTTILYMSHNNPVHVTQRSCTCHTTILSHNNSVVISNSGRVMHIALSPLYPLPAIFWILERQAQAHWQMKYGSRHIRIK